MGRILAHWRILTASVFSVALMLGAYVLARGVEHPPVAQASEEAALLGAIAAKDSDADGLPDWEEALYGTDPAKADSFGLGMTDGQAVAKGLIVPKAIADVPTATSTGATYADVDPSLPPAPADNSLTAAFAKNFFTLYLNAKEQNGGAALTSDDTSQIAQQALAQLASTVTLAPDFKSANDIAVSGSGPDALRAFAASAEAVFLANASSASTSEITYLSNAINGDTGALAQIASIAKLYRTTAAGLAVLPVPRELAQADLALVNAMARLSGVISDFARVNADPLASMLALQQYPDTVLAFGNALIAFDTVYANAGVVLGSGEKGASLVNIISSIAASQGTPALDI
jgi:hypothetical protein